MQILVFNIHDSASIKAVREIVTTLVGEAVSLKPEDVPHSFVEDASGPRQEWQPIFVRVLAVVEGPNVVNDKFTMLQARLAQVLKAKFPERKVETQVPPPIPSHAVTTL